MPTADDDDTLAADPRIHCPRDTPPVCISCPSLCISLALSLRLFHSLSAGGHYFPRIRQEEARLLRDIMGTIAAEHGRGFGDC